MKKRELPNHVFVKRALLAAIISLFVFSPRSIYADGKYFPEKAYKVPPAIPSQRAILVYRDGVEKLTIESALDGRGQDFGWIIPLPSKPTQFEKASPGLLKTLSLTIQPKITHDLTSLINVLRIVTSVIIFWCLLVFLIKPKKPFLAPLLICLIALFLASVFMPHLGTAGGTLGTKHPAVPGVKVEDIREIGSYELAVLRANNAEALDQWLESNRFLGLMEKDKPIVSDYIQTGWCFVAAKLRREGTGYSRPHPLTMAFATEVPIYPMRLTGTLDSNLYLELFVIADKKAASGKLTCELSDNYAFKKDAGRSFRGEERLPGFIGKTYHQDIGHPDATRQMWRGCVLTKLCGTLTPSQMSKDIVLKLKPDKPSQKHYYSRSGARDVGLALCLSALSALLIILTAVFYNRIREEDGKQFYLARIILPSVLLSLLLWPVTYVVLPKIAVKPLSALHVYFEHAHMLMEKQAIAEQHNYFKNMKIEEVTRVLDNYFNSKVIKNSYTGQGIKHEDSPGNYTIFEDERGIVLRTYSRQAYPHDFVLTSEPNDQHPI